jgi:uncharacterized damage-inducible protein DinB
MSKILVEIYKHNRWANLRLLDTCAVLTDEQLDASAPGTYGRVRDTLFHLCTAEERYIARLGGARPEPSLDEIGSFPGVAVLREHVERSGGALIAFAAELPDDTILRGIWRGEPYELPAVIPMIQAINHATEHRAHITTILSQHGVNVPDLDAWAYDEEMRKG